MAVKAGVVSSLTVSSNYSLGYSDYLLQTYSSVCLFSAGKIKARHGDSRVLQMQEHLPSMH